MSLSAAQRRDLARVTWSGGLAVAMTGSVLVAGALLPTAVADHGTDPLLVDDENFNITSCDDVSGLPEAPPHGPFNPVTEDNNQIADGLYEFDEATVEITGGSLFIEVVPEPGFEITAVAVKGGPATNVYFDGQFIDMTASDNPGGQQPTISHYTVCVGDEKTPPPYGTPTPTPSTPPPDEDVDAGGLCVGSVPYLDYAIDDDLFDTPVPDEGLTITFVNPDGDDVVIEDQDGEGQVLWPGAEVDEEGNGTDWPGWIFQDGSWIEADDGFEWVRPSVTVLFEWNASIETEVEYPEAGGECNPPPTEEEEDIELSILDPICDDDVPYLEYLVEPEGFEATDVTITWINPDGEDVVYENLPLGGRVLWAGAVTGPEGEPLDWPGWIQLEDGSWVEGDDGFQWVRPSVDVLFEVNPEQTLTVGYPPSSPDCAARPPLPTTGANLTIGLAGGGLLLGGLVLMLLGRRRLRSQR